MNVLITTDLEGVSGIVEWDAHDFNTRRDAWQRELMTGEINAAVAGAFDAGADRVKIAEGHDAIDILSLDARATLVPAYSPAAPLLQGWDGFDALIQIGKHSMAGTKDGVLAHTFNRHVESMTLNDILVGEIGVDAAQAGDYGFPCVMVSGDLAACREAEDLLSDVETAPVKTGYDAHHAECLSPKKARELIYTKVQAGLRQLDRFKPFVIPGPVRQVQRMKEPFTAAQLKLYRDRPYAELVDERTVAFTGRNVVESHALRCAAITGNSDPETTECIDRLVKRAADAYN